MDIRLIQVPYDSGRRGERMGQGPLHFIQQKAQARLEAHSWKVHLETIESHHPFQTELFTAFELGQRLAEQVQKAQDHGAFPVVLAGNCISCLGTLSGSAPSQLGVIWFDAHGDLNTPETTLGFLDGMALATALGRCWPQMTAKIPGFAPILEERVLMIGVRQLDPPEEAYLATSPIQVLRAETIRKIGLPVSLSKPLAQLRSQVERVYVHIDLDVFDPEVGRANTYAEPNGLRVYELEEALSLINQQFEIVSIAFTAYDPAVDTDQRIFQAAMQLMTHVLKLIEQKAV